MALPPLTRSEDGVRRYAWPVDLAMQAVLIVGAALLYFRVRGLTEGDTADAVQHGYDILHAERSLRIDVEEPFQNLVLGSHALTTFGNWVYIWGHWPVIAMTLVWLHRAHHREFLVLRNALFVSGAIGLVMFAGYPVAPPRHLPDRFVDTVTELSRSYRVLQPPRLINEYAAMPSLHMGWNLLVGIFLYRTSTRRAVRAIGVVGPVLMALAIVATGNHYVLDAVVGSAVALVGWACSAVLWRRLYTRAPRRAFAGALAPRDRACDHVSTGRASAADGTGPHMPQLTRCERAGR